MNSRRLSNLSMPGSLYADDDDLDTPITKQHQDDNLISVKSHGLPLISSQAANKAAIGGKETATLTVTLDVYTKPQEDHTNKASYSDTKPKTDHAIKRPVARSLVGRPKSYSQPLLEQQGRTLLLPPTMLQSDDPNVASASGSRANASSPTSSNSNYGPAGPLMRYLGGGRQRSRASSSSVSSTRSYSDKEGGGPGSAGSKYERTGSSAAITALADEREANLRTPRPNAAQQPRDNTPQGSLPATAAGDGTRVTAAPGPTPDLADQTVAPVAQDGSMARWRILQWQRERDNSEQDDAQAALSMESNQRSRAPSMIDSTSYPSDSLGGMSVASSALGPSASEFGSQRQLSTSESGHGQASEMRASGSGSKKKPRAVAPPEQLVVVRPPPSKQTNPLNLQIQLVTPQSTANNGSRTSGEISRDSEASGMGSVASSGFSIRLGTGPTLSRRASSTSARSAGSEVSSTGLSSVSNSSANRRVTPLYNLAFHSIMPTTVTDAGTDQKVAKFSKRGIEIDGFGLIVPQEINNPHAGNTAKSASVDAANTHGADGGVAPSVGSGVGSGSGPSSPEGRSEISHARSMESFPGPMLQSSDSGHEPPISRAAQPPTSFDAMSPEAKEPDESSAGLGIRLMRGLKRLNVNASPTLPGSNKVAPSMRSGMTDQTPGSSLFSKVSSAAAKLRDGESNATSGRTATGDETETRSTVAAHGWSASYEVPQLVVGAGIRGDGSRRASGYVWTVRRWARRTDSPHDEYTHDSTPGRHHPGANPVLNSVWKRFSMINRMGGLETHPPAREIEVRFEWTRQPFRKRSTAGSVMHSRAPTEASTRSRSKPRQMSSGEPRDTTEGLQPPGQRSRPTSVYSTSAGARSDSLRGSMDHCSVAGSAISGEDHGADSDPEDSETMWSCHLVLGPTTRIPIGSMRPTPHHPKLVAQLTIPYPLPDLSQSALGADGAGLTREELKDIISVTCLFVIIREAFGGLAKRRKGDSALRFAATAQR